VRKPCICLPEGFDTLRTDSRRMPNGLPLGLFLSPSVRSRLRKPSATFRQLSWGLVCSTWICSIVRPVRLAICSNDILAFSIFWEIVRCSSSYLGDDNTGGAWLKILITAPLGSSTKNRRTEVIPSDWTGKY
jgi:hypothetical protein